LWESYTRGGGSFGELEKIYMDGVGSYRLTGHIHFEGTTMSFTSATYCVPLSSSSFATFTVVASDEYLSGVAAFRRAMETFTWTR